MMKSTLCSLGLVSLVGLGIIGGFPESAASQDGGSLAQLQPGDGLDRVLENLSNEKLALDEVRILFPVAGETRERSTHLILQYHAESDVTIRINGQPLDRDIPTTLERDESQNLAIQIWYNIPLKAGANAIAVSANNADPTIVRLTVEGLQIAGEGSATISLKPVGDPRIPADGRSTLVFEGTIADDNGNPVTEDILVTLTASAGEFIDSDRDPDRPGFQVLARDGSFRARLRSDIQAQKVRVRAAADRHHSVGTLQATSRQQATLETFAQVEFVTHLRPSLVSGVVDLRIGSSGTDFWGSRREFLAPYTLDEGVKVELDAAFFAIGAIGEWLLTAAYNSDRPLNQTCDGMTRLFRGSQMCERHYPVYGDNSTVDYLTPSIDSVYARLERTSPTVGAEPDYLMWGDYNSNEFARPSQTFAAQTRQLHGFKGNISLGDLQISALYSPDVEGFQRDTITPDGTSGYYFLSHRLLVEGSESIIIESEEVNRPGRILETQRLNRGQDYEIDYDRGTILFRRPIQSLEFDPYGNTIARKIIATYQYDGGDETDIFAGRAQYNFSHDLETPSWLAFSYWQENQGAIDYKLYSADFLLTLSPQAAIVGEYAFSDRTSSIDGDEADSAYRLRFTGNIAPEVRAEAYYQSVEENFNNTATSSFVPGQTRYGASVSANVTPTTLVSASYDYEENFGVAPEVRTTFFDPFNPESDLLSARSEDPDGDRVNNTLTEVRAGVQQQFGNITASLDYVNRARSDRINDTFNSSSSQLVTGIRVPLTDTLAFRGQNELNLGNSHDPLYPSRTTLGLEWALSPDTTLQLAHQFYDGGLLGENSLTSLSTIMERQIGADTTISSRYALVGGQSGMRGEEAIGLHHRWTLAPGLRLDASYERILTAIDSKTASGDRFSQPYAAGQSGSSLSVSGGESYSVGFEYTFNPDFQASARVEHRDNSQGSNTVIRAAAAGKLSSSLTALVRFSQASAANQLLEDLGPTTHLKVGLAYRNPEHDAFNALLRYEYRYNPSTIPETLLFTSGTGYQDHLLGVEAIYAPNWRWEFYGKYAFRYSLTELADSFSNESFIHLGQVRTTYRLGYQWDLAAEVRWLGQPSANFSELGWVVDVGYYLTPDVRLGIGYVFGNVNDEDFSGYRSNSGVFFGVTMKVNELFNGFGRQSVTPLQQEEALNE
ncbi:MAG: hypothetical protein J7647_21425 [Cyanobacteria bacterium SBLK]|nr:hypothetical protein [Cyanobacteria bacterium SBLK]